MGQILDALFWNDPVMGVDVDFENDPSPDRSSSSEGQLIADVQEFMERATPALRSVESYGGCSQFIRAAMSNPKNQEAQDKAFDSMVPNVLCIKDYYDLANQLGPLVQRAVVLLGSSEEYLTQFQNHPALARALGKMVVFMYDFDQFKMMKPDVQNDFAFYRRMLPKMNGRRTIRVSETDAGVISMFIAQSVPMVSAVGIHLASSRIQPLPLAKLANLCCGMLQRQTLSESTQMLILKIMTSSIVLYDRSSPAGAFVANTPIKIRRCAAVISRFGGSSADSLRNSIKFSSVHYNNPNTPDWVKVAMGD